MKGLSKGRYDKTFAGEDGSTLFAPILTLVKYILLAKICSR